MRINPKKSPFTEIFISDTLNCSITYAGNREPAFYNETACGTILNVGGQSYGPEKIPAGTYKQTKFVVEDQQLVGDGSGEKPFTIITKVRAGDTGVTIEQRDEYVVGLPQLKTSVAVRNNSKAVQPLALYRAADCNLLHDDKGIGAHGEDFAACLNENTNAILKLTGAPSEDATLSVMESDPIKLWKATGQAAGLSNSSVAAKHDNAVGVAWNFTLGANEERTFTTATELVADVDPTKGLGKDSDDDGLPDEWELYGAPVGDETFPLNKFAKVGQRDMMLIIAWGDKDKACPPESLLSGEPIPDGCFAQHYPPTADQINALIDYFDEIGIKLHVDAGEELNKDIKGGERFTNPQGGPRIPYREAFAEKKDNSEDKWKEIFAQVRSDLQLKPATSAVTHVMTMLPYYSPGYDASGVGTSPGPDTYVTSQVNDHQILQTMIHELGHNLRLGHGGPKVISTSDSNWDRAWADEYKYNGKYHWRWNDNRKPAYTSVMNYCYQMKEGARFSDLTGTGKYNVRVNDCANSRTDEYQYYSDLKFLKVGSKGIGVVGPGDLVDTHFHEEPTLEEFYEQGLIDNPGKASIGFPAMPVLYTTATHDTIEIALRNQGKAKDTFKVVLQAGQYSQTKKVTLKGGEKAAVEFVIRGGTIPAGTAYVTVTATSANGTKSEQSQKFTVLAPTESEAQKKVEELESHASLSDFDRANIRVLRTVRDPQTSTVVTTAPPVTVTDTPAPTTVTQPAETVVQTSVVVETVSPTPTTEEPSESGSTESNDTVIAVVVSVLVTAFALLGGIGFAAYNNLIPGVDATKLFGR